MTWLSNSKTRTGSPKGKFEQLYSTQFVQCNPIGVLNYQSGMNRRICLKFDNV